jgi:hypothetical protein
VIVLRVRLTALGFLVLFAGGAAFMPVVLGYTFLAGDKATAQVTTCRHAKRVSCHGNWQDARGRRGSGHISGVGRDDVGRSVEVRIGPLGPYAGGLGRSWPLCLTALPILLAPPFTVVMMRRTLGPGRAFARRLLAEPPGDATLLSITSTKATGADGQEHASLHRIDAPPGFQPADLPGRRPRQKPQSAFDAAAGLARAATEFATVSGPGGEPVFVIERRGFAEYEPETWLLDPGGTAHAVIRRVSWYPARFELLRADGDRLGTIRPPDNVKSGAFVTRDQHGRQLAVMAASGRRWVLRVEPGTPPLLRDLSLAFLFDSARLQM